MVSNVLASAAILRRPFRRRRFLGLLGTACAVGLIPLALYMPEQLGARYALLLLVCLYAGRKIVQSFHGHAALKQLSMEESFLRYGATGGSVQQCVENDEHMWTRSRILLGLKAMTTHRLPSSMRVHEKQQRILQRYRRSFQKMMPQATLPDLVLLAGGALLLAATPSVAVELRALIFQAGFLALIVAIVSEIIHLVVNRRLRDGLERLFQTLSDWTIREGLERVSRSSLYSHQLHYFAQPWFAGTATPDEAGTRNAVEVVGDGVGVLPESVGAEAEESIGTGTEGSDGEPTS